MFHVSAVPVAGISGTGVTLAAGRALQWRNNTSLGLPGASGGVIGSDGTRIQFWPGVDGSTSASDYSVGMSSGTQWYNVPAAASHTFLVAAVPTLYVQSGVVTATGTLVVAGNINSVNGTLTCGKDASIGGAASITGNLTAATMSVGLITSTSAFRGAGLFSRAGASGAYTANAYNFHHIGNSATDLYIDTNRIGTIQITSDYRVKQNIVPLQDEALARINELKPVLYEFKDVGDMFTADGVQHTGFVASEVQEAGIPDGAFGVKDDVCEDGSMKLQSINTIAIVSTLVKAVQELAVKVAELEARLH